MQIEGSNGVAKSVSVMKEYSLLREDLDNLIEVCQWMEQDPWKSVESKVKAAFTRQYNKEVLLPYSTGAVGGAKRRTAAVAPEEVLEEGDDDNDNEEEDDDDISKDSMIKAKKPSKARDSKKDKESGGSRGGKGGRGGKRSKK